ncbi:Hypothetical predicted protein [Pelobates cultripes]|uniref:DUF4939 domain-containing protein n=1 Tax=Pelobates cultripes TaxID=61616 RepID=A0AAD1W6J4_PELCU|nr:Hypothetical predicted protein [Pelobates cultripes]
MDPAVVMETTCQGEILTALDLRLNALVQKMDAMTPMLQALEAKVLESTSSPADLPSSPKAGIPLMYPEIPLPACYDGNPNELRGFLTQCDVYFQIHLHAFSSHQSRVGFIILLLKGKALDWASSVMDKKSPILQSSDSFINALKTVFDLHGREALAGKALLKIQQGQKTIYQYAMAFRRLAWDTLWNESALIYAFYNGLSEEMKDALIARDMPESLNELIKICSLIDLRFQEKRQRQTRKQQKRDD